MNILSEVLATLEKRQTIPTGFATPGWKPPIGELSL